MPAQVLEALVGIGYELQAEEVHVDRLLDRVTTSVGDLLETDVAWIALLDETLGRVRVASARGNAAEEFEHMEVKLGEGLGGAALQRRQTLVIEDYPHWAAPGPVRETMLREDMRSVICAPMLRGSNMVGALYVGNRRTTPFERVHASTVTALASQASVAIQNARLMRRLFEKTSALESTFEIHRRLDAAAIADDSVETVVAQLAEIVGRELRLEQEIVPPFGCRVAPAGVAAHDVIATVMPLLAAGGELGRLTVYGRRPLTDLERNALSHGTTVLSLALMRHRSAHEVEWRLRGDLLDELISGTPADAPAVVARAQRLGVDLGLPHRLLAFEAPQGMRKLLTRVVAEVVATVPLPRAARAFGTWRGRRNVLAVIGEGVDVRRLADAIVDDPRLAGRPVTVGISGTGTSFPQALRQAEACCAVAAAAGRTRVMDHDELGPLRFMLDGGGLEHATAHVREVLGEIADHDRASGGQLLETLRAYVEEDGHHARIAERCHIHRSTVKYRLARIAELLEDPLRDPRTKFQLGLAFRILDVLRGLGRDPLQRPT